jgi:hypothetical protein
MTTINLDTVFKGVVCRTESGRLSRTKTNFSDSIAMVRYVSVGTSKNINENNEIWNASGSLFGDLIVEKSCKKLLITDDIEVLYSDEFEDKSKIVAMLFHDHTISCRLLFETGEDRNLEGTNEVSEENILTTIAFPLKCEEKFVYLVHRVSLSQNSEKNIIVEEKYYSPDLGILHGNYIRFNKERKVSLLRKEAEKEHQELLDLLASNRKIFVTGVNEGKIKVTKHSEFLIADPRICEKFLLKSYSKPHYRLRLPEIGLIEEAKKLPGVPTTNLDYIKQLYGKKRLVRTSTIPALPNSIERKTTFYTKNGRCIEVQHGLSLEFDASLKSLPEKTIEDLEKSEIGDSVEVILRVNG